MHYWGPIAERYGINLTVVKTTVDPTFRFMTVDWDGQIRMDPSSPYAMQSLIGLKDRFEIAFACDTDHDRQGLSPEAPGSCLLITIFRSQSSISSDNRPDWRHGSSNREDGRQQPDDRSCHRELGRKLYEVPVGFKWFVDGLLDGSLGFGGEESAGAWFVRRRWRSMDHRQRRNRAGPAFGGNSGRKRAAIPAKSISDLTRQFGEPAYDRVEAPATPSQKDPLRSFLRSRSMQKNWAKKSRQYSPMLQATAPHRRVESGATSGWFAARPSGTEDIYKIYAESFRGADHLRPNFGGGQAIVGKALGRLRIE